MAQNTAAMARARIKLRARIAQTKHTANTAIKQRIAAAKPVDVRTRVKAARQRVAEVQERLQAPRNAVIMQRLAQRKDAMLDERLEDLRVRLAAKIEQGKTAPQFIKVAGKLFEKVADGPLTETALDELEFLREELKNATGANEYFRIKNEIEQLEAYINSKPESEYPAEGMSEAELYGREFEDEFTYPGEELNDYTAQRKYEFSASTKAPQFIKVAGKLFEKVAEGYGEIQYQLDKLNSLIESGLTHGDPDVDAVWNQLVALHAGNEEAALDAFIEYSQDKTVGDLTASSRSAAVEAAPQFIKVAGKLFQRDDKATQERQAAVAAEAPQFIKVAGKLFVRQD